MTLNVMCREAPNRMNPYNRCDESQEQQAGGSEADGLRGIFPTGSILRLETWTYESENLRSVTTPCMI